MPKEKEELKEKIKIKDIAIIISFLVIIIGLFIISIFTKDIEVSISERRVFAKLPEISSIVETNFSKNFENYAMDQFPFREEFRTIKTYFELNIFKKKDNNDLYIYNEGIVKKDSLNETSVKKVANKVNEIYSKYLNSENNVYYTIIPEKSKYVPEDLGYDNLDFEYSCNIFTNNLNSNIKYIDISKDLTYESYFKLDSHWKQSKIIDVANTLLEELNSKEYIPVNILEFDKYSIEDFYRSILWTTSVYNGK